MTWTFRNIALRCSLALAVVILILAFALVTSTNGLHGTAHQMANVTQSLLDTQELESNILIHSRESLLWYLTTDDSHLEKRESVKVIFENWLEQIQSHAATPLEQTLVNRISKSAQDYFKARDDAEKKEAPAVVIANLVVPTTDRLLADIEDYSKLNLENSNRTQQMAYQEERKATLLGAISIVAAIFGGFIVLLFLRFHVYIPLTQLVASIKHLGAGGNVSPIRTKINDVSIIWQALDDSSKKIQHQKEMQLRYLAAVAHDLRNPLGAITTSTHLLLEENDMPSESKEIMDIVNRQVGYLNNMVSDLLDTTRAEAGSLSLKRSVSDLRIAVSESVNLFRSYSQIHSLVFTEPPDPIFSNFDSVRMSQVLNNIISNAVKYSPFGGFIQISLKEVDANAVIEVRDFGIGISEEEKESIFEPFRRSNSTMNTIPGVGLGLFTAQKIIVSHGGTITFESVKGMGTTFIITLPLALPASFLSDQTKHVYEAAMIDG